MIFLLFMHFPPTSLSFPCHFFVPHIIFLNFKLNNIHAQRAYFKMYDNAMELCETTEAKEGVDNIGGQLGAFLPVLAQDTRQCTNNCLCKK